MLYFFKNIWGLRSVGQSATRMKLLKCFALEIFLSLKFLLLDRPDAGKLNFFLFDLLHPRGQLKIAASDKYKIVS